MPCQPCMEQPHQLPKQGNPAASASPMQVHGAGVITEAEVHHGVELLLKWKGHGKSSRASVAAARLLGCRMNAPTCPLSPAATLPTQACPLAACSPC